MDNNNYSQPQYNQTYGQQPYAQAYGQPPVIDPTYESRAKDFLTKTIVSCCIAGIPVGSIIAIFMASNNRKALLEYIAQGGPHTTKLKVCSALSRAAKYAGIGYTFFWAFYLLYFAFFIFAGIIGIVSSYGG